MPSSSASTPCSHLYPANWRASRLPATIFCTVRASEYVSVCTTWLLRTDVADAMKLSSPLCPSSRYCTVRALPSHWRKYRNGWPVRFCMENPTWMKVRTWICYSTVQYSTVQYSAMQHCMRLDIGEILLSYSMNDKYAQDDKHVFTPLHSLHHSHSHAVILAYLCIVQKGRRQNMFDLDISVWIHSSFPSFEKVRHVLLKYYGWVRLGKK